MALTNTAEYSFLTDAGLEEVAARESGMATSLHEWAQPDAPFSKWHEFLQQLPEFIDIVAPVCSRIARLRLR